MCAYFCPECGNLYDVTNVQPEASEIEKSSNIKKIYFTCTTCGYSELLKPDTLLISKQSHEVAKSYYSSHTKPADMLNIKVLMHTRDYVCPNKECPTHKKPETRNAIMNRIGNTYQMQYICSICNTKWAVS